MNPLVVLTICFFSFLVISVITAALLAACGKMSARITITLPAPARRTATASAEAGSGTVAPIARGRRP